MRVLILGGGLTGLMAAIASRSYASTLLIVDPKPLEQTTDPGRLILCPDTLNHLHSLGIIEGCDDIFIPLSKRWCTVGGMTYPDNPQGYGLYTYPVVVEEKALRNRLYDNVPDITVLRYIPRTIQHHETHISVILDPVDDERIDDNEGVAIATQETRQDDFDLVLACDGSSSRVRNHFFVEETRNDIIALWCKQSIITISRGDTQKRKVGESRVIVGNCVIDEYRCINETSIIHNRLGYQESDTNYDPSDYIASLGCQCETTTIRKYCTGTHHVYNPVKGGIVLCGSAVMHLPLIGGSNANLRQLIPRIPRRFAYAHGYTYPLWKTLGTELSHSCRMIYQNYNAIINTMMQSRRHDRIRKIIYVWTNKTPGWIGKLYSTMDTYHPEVGSLDTRYPSFLESLLSHPRIRINGRSFFHGPNPGTIVPSGYLVLEANKSKVSRRNLLINKKPIIMILQGLSGGSKNESKKICVTLTKHYQKQFDIYVVTNTYMLEDDDDAQCLGDPGGLFHTSLHARGPCIYCIYPSGTIGRRSLGYRINDLNRWCSLYFHDTVNTNIDIDNNHP